MRTPLYSVLALEPLPRCSVSCATAINDKGQVIGYSHNEKTDEAIACLWEDGKVHDLGRIAVNSINNKGQIVGERFNASCHFCAILMENRRPRNLFQNNTPISGAKGINDAGQVVGYAQTPLTKSDWPPVMKRGAFCWERGKRHYLEVPPGCWADKATAINNAGEIVGNVCDAKGKYAVIWRDDSVTLLGEPDGFRTTEAIAVNDVGQILVRAARVEWAELTEADRDLGHDLGQQSFLWQHGQWQAISGMGLAHSLNNHGQLVGWIGMDPETAPGANQRGDTHAAF